MLEPIPNTPIVNAGLLYVNGLQLLYTTTTTVILNPGGARDSTNIDDIILDTSVTINGAKIGANGIDKAILATNSIYAVYVIGDSTKYQPTAGLLSLNSATPSLPFGYDMFRRVGWICTDSGPDILPFIQYGVNEERKYYYEFAAKLQVLTNGTATSFTNVNLSSVVPPINTEVWFGVLYVPALSSGIAQFLPFNFGGPNVTTFFGYGVAAQQSGMLTLPATLNGIQPTIQYKVASGDSLTLRVAGYTDYLS